jgi:hypothetical protein
MPLFVAQHTPGGLDEFTTAYLNAAEWLLDDDADRTKIRGFAPSAVKRAVRDCLKFQMDHAPELEAFSEATERDLDLAGYCFWMDRAGSGTGFWDRDAGEIGDTLSRASRDWATCYSEVYRGWIYLT